MNKDVITKNLIVTELQDKFAPMIDAIYTIDCNKYYNNCKSCKDKYHTGRWCPKGYADEINEGIGLIISNWCTVKKIANIIMEDNTNESL